MTRSPDTEAIVWQAYQRYREIIPDFDAFLDALTRPVPHHLRVNTLKTSPEALRERLVRLGARVTPEPLNPLVFRVEGLPSVGRQIEYHLGLYHPQGLTSTFPVLVLDPRPGEFVLDMAASPGGKTSQMAAQMQNTGHILANDVTLERVGYLKSNLERLGVLNTSTRVGPAQQIPKELRFDKVLLDAPCSGLGAWRSGLPPPMGRHANQIERMSRIQQHMILRAYDVLKPGGRLVYSTCTLAPEENERVVQWLLDKREGAFLEAFDLGQAQPGLTEWQNERFDSSLRLTRRYYPHQIDSWGFFIAAIGKR